MNKVLEVLKNRRSIRSYLDTQISNEELEAVLEAGRYAPSGLNRQTSIFIVVQNKELLSKLVEKCSRNGNDPFYQAPTIVLVFSDTTSSLYLQDGSLALGNMMNAAAGLQLGSCWINSPSNYFKTEEGRVMKEELTVPSSYECIGCCTLGYIKGEYPEAKPRKENTVKYYR